MIDLEELRNPAYRSAALCNEAAAEIERLQSAKRRALQLADERAKEAATLRIECASATRMLNESMGEAGRLRAELERVATRLLENAFSLWEASILLRAEHPKMHAAYKKAAQDSLSAIGIKPSDYEQTVEGKQ